MGERGSRLRTDLAAIDEVDERRSVTSAPATEVDHDAFASASSGGARYAPPKRLSRSRWLRRLRSA